MNFGEILLWIPPLLLAISVHEWAHGMSAWYCGDPTAKLSGRLTLNPIAHFDPVGTTMLILTAVLVRIPFGWAKPIPVNYYGLRSPKRDMALVAAAGPASNILLASVSVALLRGLATPASLLDPQPWHLMLVFSILVNCGLAIFNILPVHPLDGSRILAGLLPYPYSEKYARLEPYGFIILMIMIFTRATDVILRPLWMGLFHLMNGLSGNVLIYYLQA